LTAAVFTQKPRRSPFPDKGIGVCPGTVQKKPGEKPVPQAAAVTGV
jgi:hypothetical protein